MFCSLSNVYEEGIVYNLPFRDYLRTMLQLEFGTPRIIPAEHRCKSQTAVSPAKLVESNDDTAKTFQDQPMSANTLMQSFVAADSRNKSLIFRLKRSVNHIINAFEGDNGGGGHYVAYTQT